VLKKYQVRNYTLYRRVTPRTPKKAAMAPGTRRSAEDLPEAEVLAEEPLAVEDLEVLAPEAVPLGEVPAAVPEVAAPVAPVVAAPVAPAVLPPPAAPEVAGEL
jgi:hypothetical protein